MRVSSTGIDQIKQHEGLRLKAYPDPATGAEPWTIGYGQTFYPNGIKVAKGDQITKEEALEMLVKIVDNFAQKVDHLVKTTVNQNQFDALVSFAYNVGIGAFGNSTLLKKINVNPNDPTIASEFAKWNKAAGKVFPGLTKRRKQEADLYFKK